MDCSPPGPSSVYGILQARILAWVAVPASGDLPDPGTEPGSPPLQTDSLSTEPRGSPQPLIWGILLHGLSWDSFHLTWSGSTGCSVRSCLPSSRHTSILYSGMVLVVRTPAGSFLPPLPPLPAASSHSWPPNSNARSPSSPLVEIFLLPPCTGSVTSWSHTVGPLRHPLPEESSGWTLPSALGPDARDEVGAQNCRSGRFLKSQATRGWHRILTRCLWHPYCAVGTQGLPGLLGTREVKATVVRQRCYVSSPPSFALECPVESLGTSTACRVPADGTQGR